MLKHNEQMHARRKSSTEASAIELLPENYFAPLALRTIFGNAAPLEVDLGCGDGAYLAALAAQNSERNFLGIERLRGRVRSACQKLAQRGLTNGRVLRIESSYAVEYLLPPQSVSVFHLLFPDPWPKRRHHVRRIFTAAFAASLSRALEQNGTLRIATDHRDYFEQMLAITSEDFGIIRESDQAEPMTTFERHYHRANVPIYRASLRKKSEVR